MAHSGRVTFLSVLKGLLATAAASAQAPLIISELRLRGPGGSADEFIEIYNHSNSPVMVSSGGGSPGFGVVASDGLLRCTIPNGTIIPARGHFLCVNSGSYSLTGYPAGNGTALGDAAYTTSIDDNAGIALFGTALSGNFTIGNRLDAVGPTTEGNIVYREGPGYVPLAVASVEFSVVRRVDPVTGLPVDTGSNGADFRVVATNGNATLSAAALGAPAPENLTSPVSSAPAIAGSLVAPCVTAATAPNLVRVGSGNSGTLSIRQKFTNVTGANLTRLRFRIVDLTTSPAPNGSTAVLAATTSTTTTEATPCGIGNVTIRGLTLEVPPAQAQGGGYNSSVSAPVTQASPLAPDASMNVNFLVNVAQSGAFRFAVILEALPTGGGVYEMSGSTEGPVVVTPTPTTGLPTATRTRTRTPTSTVTHTATRTATVTPTATSTATRTATITPTATRTPTATFSPTVTRTPTPTVTPTGPTVTPSPTSTPSATGTATSSPTPTATALPVSATSLHTLAPCRLADTREPAGPRGGPALQSGLPRSFPVAGFCGVPASAQGVAINVTVIQPTAEGFLTLHPTGQPPPSASTLNFRAGTVRANNAVLRLGAGGEITVTYGVAVGPATADFVLDVSGYFE